MKKSDWVSFLDFGDAVRWCSQSGGYWKEKVGNFVSYIPRGAPLNLAAELLGVPKSRLHFSTSPGKVDRVLLVVAVPAKRSGASSGEYHAHYYAPTRGQLAADGKKVRTRRG